MVARKKPRSHRNVSRLRMMFREHKGEFTTQAIADHILRESKPRYRRGSTTRLLNKLAKDGILRKIDPEEGEADPTWELIDAAKLKALINAKPPKKKRKPSERSKSGRTQAKHDDPDTSSGEPGATRTGDPGSSRGEEGDASGTAIVQAFDGPPKVMDGKMVRNAITKRWETNPDVRKALMSRIGMRGLETEDDEVLARMVRLYIDAERQNQIDDHKVVPDEVIIRDAGPISAEHRRAALVGAITAELAKRAQRAGLTVDEYRAQLDAGDRTVSGDGDPGTDELIAG